MQHVGLMKELRRTAWVAAIPRAVRAIRPTISVIPLDSVLGVSLSTSLGVSLGVSLTLSILYTLVYSLE